MSRKSLGVQPKRARNARLKCAGSVNPHDAANAPMFEGEAPFSFRRGEKTITTNLVKLPAACFDDADMLVRYAASSLEAARRSAAKKPPRRARRGVRKER